MNLYSYVTNNPTNIRDPLGLDGDEDESFLSLMGSYGIGVLDGIEGYVIGTIKLPFNLVRHPVDTVGGIADDLIMRAKTFYGIAVDPSGAKEAIIDSIFVLGPNKSMEILGNAGGQVIAMEATRVAAVYVKNMARFGREIKVGSNCRIAPFGNRTGHPTGKYPHNHRGVPDPRKPGQGKPDQGIRRHRPWDTGGTDKSWRDRF